MQSWLMWLCAALFYAYQYILRVIPNVLKVDLTQSFNMDAQLFGQFAGIYYIGYTLAHIPVGIALDKYGPKYVLPFCTLLCVLGLMPLVYAEHSIYPIVGRCLIGIGSSGAILGLIKVIRIGFEEQKFSQMLSIAATIGVAGAVFGGSPVHLLLEHLSWKTVIILISGLGVALSFIMIMVYPKVKPEETGSPIESIKLILKNKWVWFISLASGFLIGPLEGYADAWSTQSLMELYGVSAITASHGVSVIFLSLGVGFIFINFIEKYLKTDKTIILSGVMLLLCFLTVISGKVPFWVAMVGLVGLGFFSSYQVPAITRAIRLLPASAASLGGAVVNMIMMVFGSYFHSIIGGCMSYFGTNIETGVCTFDPSVYQKGLMIIPIMLIIGSLMFVFLSVKKKEA